MTAYRVPHDLAYDVIEAESQESAPTVYLMRLPDGQPLMLRDMGAWIWLLAADGVPNIAEEIADATSVDVQKIGPEVAGFLATLVNDGLLEGARSTHGGA